MATRECLTSEARNQARVSSDPSVARPRGSKVLSGMVLPAISSIFPMLKAEDDFWDVEVNAAALVDRARTIPATFMMTFLLMYGRIEMIPSDPNNRSLPFSKRVGVQRHGVDRAIATSTWTLFVQNRCLCFSVDRTQPRDPLKSLHV